MSDRSIELCTAAGACTHPVTVITSDVTEDAVSFTPDPPAHGGIKGYRLVRPLGVRGQGGGQAEVFEAFQESTTQRVAIKILRETPDQSATARKQFRREIELLAQVKHPNIITIHEAGETTDGRLFFAMEFVGGTDLRTYIREHRLCLTQMLALFIEVCEAVNHLHERGIVHRDLKPENILVDESGRVKVLDLGLARPRALPELMNAGGWAGTLPYLSPEQTRPQNNEIDSRSDVYSLGVVLYELLTGRYPYPITGSVEEVFDRIRHTPPIRPRKRWNRKAIPYSLVDRRCPIDTELESVVLKALAKEREGRYSSAGELGKNVTMYLRCEAVVPGPRNIPTGLYSGLAGLRRWVQRQPFAAFGFLTLLTWTVAEFPGTRLLHLWTSAHEKYGRLLQSWVPPSALSTALEHVRVVELTDQAISELADEYGVEPKDLGKRLRTLHARVFEALAKSGCRAVVSDFWFRVSSEFDSEVAHGIQSLRNKGIDVVMITRNWWLDPLDRPELGEALSGMAIPGAMGTEVSEAGWRIAVTAQRGLGDPLPSMALAGFAAFRQPGARYDIRIDRNTSTVGLFYYRFDEGRPPNKISLGEEDRFRVSHVSVSNDGTGVFSPEAGLKPRDTVALLMLSVPQNDILARCTVKYEDLLSANTEQLQTWFRDRVVVLGNTSSLIPERAVPTPDGRNVAGVYFHAIAMDTMLRSVALGTLNRTAEALAALFLSVLGCFTALVTAGRPLRRWLFLAGWTALSVFGSLTLFWRATYFWSALVPVLGLWLTAESCAFVGRRCRRRTAA